jgi:hypothetical protein
MREVDDPNGDFPRLFRPAWEHRLPDGTVARILRRDVIPVREDSGEVIRRLQQSATDLAARYFREAKDIRIDVEPESDIETRRGRFRRVEIRIREAALGGRRTSSPLLYASGIRLEALGLEINPYRLLREGKLEVLGLREASPSIEVRDADASAYLSRLLRGPASVRFSGGRIRVAAEPPRRMPAFALDIELRIDHGDNLGFRVRRARLAGIPVPPLLVEALTAGNNPILKPMPCRVRLEGLSIDDGWLRLGATRPGS